jgi:ribosomal protein S18 acetylase RimI-like enzyme
MQAGNHCTILKGVIMEIIIRNPETDMQGNSAENIFIAFDENNSYLGHGYVYVYVNTDMTPDHPLNLHVSIQVDEQAPKAMEIKDCLFGKLMERAYALRKGKQELKARIYAGCLSEEHEKLLYFLNKGFIHDDGTYLFERDLSIPIPEQPFPEETVVRVNRMEVREAKQEFLDLHKSYFVREFNEETLSELMKEKGWMNISAFMGNRLAGNILLYEKADEEGVGIIDDLFVIREFRGLGIGKLLLCTALRYFMDVGLQKAQLHVWGANKRAVALYRSMDFVFLEEKECYPGIPA